MNRNIMILAFLGVALLPTQAQTVRSLDECRRMALEHNASVRNAVNNVEAAKQEQKSAFTKYFPTLSASGTAFNANKHLVQMNMGGGMALSLVKDGVTGGVTLMQPVFMGGQILNGNKLAKVGVTVSGLQREQAEQEVRLTVEKYYWQVAVLKEKLVTVAAIDTMLSRLCGDVAAAVKVGVTTRNDLLQVQLRRNDIESTRSNLVNNLEVCRMLLAQYIGADDEQTDVSADIDVGSAPMFPQELYCEPQSALPLTPEYRLLESNVEANRLQRKLAVGKNLPSVVAGAGYMYENLLDRSNSFALVDVTVSVPISGWWGGSHDIRKQKLRLANAENDLNDNAELLQIRMRKAWTDLQDAHRQTLIAQKSIEQSAENLRLNQDYYKAGTVTMSDLLDAQRLYQQSRDKFAEAYSQFKMKQTEYLIATGR